MQAAEWEGGFGPHPDLPQAAAGPTGTQPSGTNPLCSGQELQGWLPWLPKRREIIGLLVEMMPWGLEWEPMSLLDVSQSPLRSKQWVWGGSDYPADMALNPGFPTC